MFRSTLLGLGAATLAGGLAHAQSFNYPDFTSTAGLSTVGLAAQSGTILRIQDNVAPANGGDNRGALWYATAVNVVGGFDTTFVYSMNTPSTTGGSDGLAFVIQNDLVASSAPIVNGSPDGIGNMAIGRHASAAGFGAFLNPVAGDSVDNSLAIHLDTYNNASPWGDLNSNHISVHTGGTADNSQDESFSIGRTGFLTTDLNDGANHTVRVLYVPGTLEVYVDGALELTVAYDFNTGGTYTDSAAAIGGLNLVSGTSAFVGFTSGAGSARENRDIVSWSFVSSSVNTGAAYCFGDGTGAACPCAAFGAPGAGCMSTSGTGATLVASGNADVANDSWQLDVSGAPANKPGLFFQGTNRLSNVTAGDGILCSNSSLRYAVNSTDANGNVTQTGFGANAMAGQTLNYQYWFRDTGNPCNAGGFNFSNGWATTWQ